MANTSDGLELKDFVKSALKQISDAMYEFTEEAEESGRATALPNFKTFGATEAAKLRLLEVADKTIEENGHRTKIRTKFASVVDFDIAVTVSKSLGGKGQGSARVGIEVISLKLAEFGLGGDLDIGKSDSRVSRLTFSVPLQVHLPTRIAERENQSATANTGTYSSSNASGEEKTVKRTIGSVGSTPRLGYVSNDGAGATHIVGDIFTATENDEEGGSAP